MMGNSKDKSIAKHKAPSVKEYSSSVSDDDNNATTNGNKDHDD